MKRYVLYDFDSDQLATSTVYDDYDEAQQDAVALDNVLILTLPVQSAPIEATVADLPREVLVDIVSTLLGKFERDGDAVEWDNQDVADCAYRLLERYGLLGH